MSVSEPIRLAEQLNLKALSSIAIVGLGKDAWKTTVLNHIMRAAEQAMPKRSLAITSIGRDGEPEDVVTGNVKPRVYVKKGQLVGTARRSIMRGDASMEVLGLSGIRTAEGEVSILQARSNGFVELAGPSIASDITRLEQQLRSFAPDCLMLIDGALSRNSPAGGGLTEAVVLVGGMANASNIEELAHKIKKQVTNLTRPALDQDLRALASDAFSDHPKARVLIFSGPGEIRRILELPALIGHGEEIKKALLPDDTVLVLRGAMTSRVVSELLNSEHFEKIKLVAEDGTRYFIDDQTMKRLAQRDVTLHVLHPLLLPLVIVNPKAVDGHAVDVDSLIHTVSSEIEVPVAQLGASGW